MSNATEDKPVKVTAEKLFTLPGALLISVVILAGSIGIGWANLKSQVDEVPVIKARLDDVEKDLRKIDVLVNDVGWIKQELQRQAREDRRRPTTPGSP
jgi:hypothetical protein